MDHLWSIVKDDAWVTVRVGVDEPGQAVVAYELLANMLTQLGYTEATDDFESVDDDDYLHALD